MVGATTVMILMYWEIRDSSSPSWQELAEFLHDTLYIMVGPLVAKEVDYIEDNNVVVEHAW